MGTVATRGSSDYQLPPEDTYSAVCVAVIDLGTTFDEKWGKWKHKVLITWALDAEGDSGDVDGDFVVHQRYNLSLHERATLRKHLEAWRGRGFTEEELDGFELADLLGAPCLIGVIHNTNDGKTYANIGSISKLPKGMKKLVADKTTYFNLDKPDMEVFRSFHENLQDRIKQAKEWPGNATAEDQSQDPADFGDDEIPF